MANDSPLQDLVSKVGKVADTAVAEPPKPEATPETTPVDAGATPTETPKETETPKTEETKPEGGTETKSSEKPEDKPAETKPGEEAKPEGTTTDKPEGEPKEPIDWGSKKYLADKQSKNGEDTLKYKELYDDVGKALNLPANSGKDVILREVESIKSQAVASDNIFANESLRQANEIAKNKGDWASFLGLATMNVDRSDEELIRLKMQENGNSEELINEYIEEHKDTPGFKKEGSEIRQSLTYTREQRTKEIADQAKVSEDQRNVQTREANERLRKVINEATDINGFSLDDEAKARILDIATGTTTIGEQKVSKLFAYFLYDEKGNLDPQKTFNTIAKAEYFDGVTNFLKSEGKTEGKRETMDNLQNVDLGTQPAASREEKPEEETGLGALNRVAKEKGMKPLQAIHA